MKRANDARPVGRVERPVGRATAWTPTIERLPPLDVPVWLYLPSGQIIQGGRFDGDGDGWMWCNCYASAWYDSETGRWEAEDAQLDDDYAPTHWMPLPLPPNT